MNIDILIEKNPFKYNTKDKNKFFLPAIKEAFNFHYKNNLYFRKWLDHIGFKHSYEDISNLPFFPSAVFKYLDFSSKNINKNNKIIRSSGTSSQLKK